MRPIILLLFIASMATAQEHQNSLSIRLAGEATLFSELDDAVATGGIGLEARMGNHWSIVSDFMWGSFDDTRVFTVRPDVRLYFKDTFSGFFLKGGIGYYSFQARDNNLLPYPFDLEDGEDVNFLTLHAGLGFSTIVLERWNMGLNLSFGGAFDSDLEAFVGVGLNVGYLF